MELYTVQVLLLLLLLPLKTEFVFLVIPLFTLPEALLHAQPAPLMQPAAFCLQQLKTNELYLSQEAHAVHWKASASLVAVV